MSPYGRLLSRRASVSATACIGAQGRNLDSQAAGRRRRPSDALRWGLADDALDAWQRHPALCRSTTGAGAGAGMVRRAGAEGPPGREDVAAGPFTVGDALDAYLAWYKASTGKP